MLKTLRRIKNLGLVFKDFTWGDAGSDLKQVNLIYGWNGSGKTTLTRLFDELAGSKSDVEYELEDIDGNVVTQSDAFEHSVRVFNQNYVQRNVRVLEAQAETISVVLGAENQELLAKIAAHEVRLNGDAKRPDEPGLIYKGRQDKTKSDRQIRQREDLFTRAAGSIRTAAAGSAGTPHTYRSPDAKKDYEATEGRRHLDEDALAQRLAVLHQEAQEAVEPAAWPEVQLGSGRPVRMIEAVDRLHREVVELLAQTPEAVVLARLAANPDIAEWVEKGHQLHGRHDPSTCEYCGAPISEQRVRELAAHFSQAEVRLRDALDVQTQHWRSLYAAIDRWQLPDKARLYSDLRPQFEAITEEFHSAKAKLLSQVTDVGRTLVRKRGSTHESLAVFEAIHTQPINALIEGAQALFVEHNKRSAAFEQSKANAFVDVRDHYLSMIYREVRDLASSHDALVEEMKADEEVVAKLTKELDEFRSQVSSAHRACELLNKGLVAFLGRAELRFEPQPIEQGEVTAFGIFRGDQPAVHLSEGEKTAIAFVYFVVHLQDGTMPDGTGLVVIDDPVSSLDTNSLYQAFAFLKGAVRNRHQVFLLTHNFDFLKLLLNWRSRQRRDTGYFMIGNKVADGTRRAEIVPLDKVLREYETEYLWLFKKLKQLRTEQDGTISAAYPVPNLARKLWDSFLMFRVPAAGSAYSRMEQLKADGFDAQKLDAIYKFTNDQSHITGSGFDPALVPETINAINAIFDLMKDCAPDHFKILDDNTN